MQRAEQGVCEEHGLPARIDEVGERERQDQSEYPLFPDRQCPEVESPRELHAVEPHPYRQREDQRERADAEEGMPHGRTQGRFEVGAEQSAHLRHGKDDQCDEENRQTVAEKDVAKARQARAGEIRRALQPALGAEPHCRIGGVHGSGSHGRRTPGPDNCVVNVAQQPTHADLDAVEPVETAPDMAQGGDRRVDRKLRARSRIRGPQGRAARGLGGHMREASATDVPPNAGHQDGHARAEQDHDASRDIQRIAAALAHGAVARGCGFSARAARAGFSADR